MLEAQRKDAAAERHIRNRVDAETTKIKTKSDETLKKARRTMLAINGSIAPALAVYAVVLTVIWCLGQQEVLKTFPEWFVRRWDNIKTIGIGIAAAWNWIRGWIPQAPDVVRSLIALVVFAGVLFGVGVLVRAIVRRFWAWYRGIWNQYQDRNEKRLKWAVTIAICGLSFLAAVLLARITPFLWFSWFLFLSVAGNLIYHATGKNHFDPF